MKRIYKSGATRWLKNRIYENKRAYELNYAYQQNFKFKDARNTRAFNELEEMFCEKYELKKDEQFEVEGRGLFGRHPIYEFTPMSFISDFLIMKNILNRNMLK